MSRNLKTKKSTKGKIPTLYNVSVFVKRPKKRMLFAGLGTCSTELHLDSLEAGVATFTNPVLALFINMDGQWVIIDLTKYNDSMVPFRYSLVTETIKEDAKFRHEEVVRIVIPWSRSFIAEVMENATPWVKT